MHRDVDTDGGFSLIELMAALLVWAS